MEYVFTRVAQNRIVVSKYYVQVVLSIPVHSIGDMKIVIRMCMGAVNLSVRLTSIKPCNILEHIFL